ncbi:MAG: hypothetical protein JST64_01550 [Actinobacteria bacterium]|nr:hypothetical protein [Actinomycetota bacterium]
MSSRCNHHPPKDLVPLGTEQVDGVLSVMAGLDDRTVVYVEPGHGAHGTLGLQPLPADPRCSAAGMFGMRAPQGASLVGLCFSGHPASTHPGPGCTGEPLLHAIDDDRVEAHQRIDVVVTASGSLHARIHQPDGTTAPTVGRPRGVVVDALHRVLSLPVPGPRPTLVALVVGMWMTEVLAATAGPSAPTWTQIAALHERSLGPDRARGAAGLTPQAVAESLRSLTDGATWQGLHHAAAVGRMAAPELEAEEAAWMDTTMFSRWMVDSFPSPEVVLRRLGHIGSDHAARCVDAAIRHLDPSTPRTWADVELDPPRADTA